MTAYIYRGERRDLGIDLITANQAIMAVRDAGPPQAGTMPDAWFEWPGMRRARLAAETICGTDAGYKRHRKHHGTPCEACRAAHNAANRVRLARKQATS